MLTKEQIENLQPGDECIALLKFESASKSSLLFELPGMEMIEISQRNRSCLSLPPARPLKRGDKVRYNHRDGRKIARLEDGVIYEVKQDESTWGTVEIWTCPYERYEVYPYSIFELVQPAENLPPYSIDPANTDRVLKYGILVATFEDDDAAEEYCKMINNEWRKEQNNG